MRVAITKHAEGHTAEVTPFDIALEWLTEKPMDLLSLQKALYEVGFSVIDISDALGAADPEIRKEQEKARFRALSDRVGPDRAAQVMKETDEGVRREEEAADTRIDESR